MKYKTAYCSLAQEESPLLWYGKLPLRQTLQATRLLHVRALALPAARRPGMAKMLCLVHQTPNVGCSTRMPLGVRTCCRTSLGLVCLLWTDCRHTSCCQNPINAAAEELPDPSIVPGLRTALDAGYIPCLEAVLRRRLVPYMLDHECKRYSCTSSTGPHALTCGYQGWQEDYRPVAWAILEMKLATEARVVG